VNAREGRAPLRTQSSFAVSAGDRNWILVNASSDLPRQLAATPELWPQAARAAPFRTILLTDANVDHTAGLAELRQDPDALTIVSSRPVKELLAGERAYERFDHAPHRWVAVDPNQTGIANAITRLAPKLEITALEVPGLLPGYAGRAAARGAVLAYLFRDAAADATLLIAPVFSDINAPLHEAVARADLALLDGTFFSDDEMPALELMGKTARQLGHLPIGGQGGTLERVSSLKGRRVFVHINNSNPILDTRSAAHAEVLQAGCEIAVDGWHASVIRARTTLS